MTSEPFTTTKCILFELGGSIVVGVSSCSERSMYIYISITSAHIYSDKDAAAIIFAWEWLMVILDVMTQTEEKSMFIINIDAFEEYIGKFIVTQI